MKRLAIYLFVVFFFLPGKMKSQEVKITVGGIDKDLSKDTVALFKYMRDASAFNIAPDSGVALFAKTLAISKKINNYNGIALSLLGLIRNYERKGEYDKCLELCRYAEPYCLKAGYHNGMLIVPLYEGIAAIYGNQAIVDSSALYHYKALEQYQKRHVNDTSLLLLIYSNLGCALTVNKQLDQAEYYLNEGIQIASVNKNNGMLSELYLAKAGIFIERDKIDSATLYVRHTLSLLKNAPPSESIPAYCLLGDIYNNEGMPQKAIVEYKKAFNNNINISRYQRINVNLGLGRAYCQLENYNVAKNYYLSALPISQESKINGSTLECYDSLSSVYAHLHDYEQAFRYKNLYSDLVQNVMNADKVKTFNQLEVKYRSSEKDKDIAEKKLLLTKQQNEISRKNKWMIIIGGCGLLFALLIWTVYRSRKHKQDMAITRMEKEREINQLVAAIEGEEKERTRMGRELHDGIMVQFSAAQMNLSALIEKTQPGNLDGFEQILCQLEDATKELRKSAHNLMPDILLEEGLIEAAHYFCKTLQKSTDIEIDFQVYGNMPRIAVEFELMIYRIIQELLQNAIKHAQASLILLQINCHTDIITITVEDNGIGFDMNKKKTERGIGLTGIFRRVNSLHGTIAMNVKEGKGAAFYIELETKYLEIKTGKDYAYSNNS